MNNLLKNPCPNYSFERGAKCHLAVDNAHGGLTITAEIISKTTIDSNDAYVVRYTDTENPEREVEITTPVGYVFTSLDEITDVRKYDESLQIKNIESICSSTDSLIAFLLSRAELTGAEKRVIPDKIKQLQQTRPVSKQKLEVETPAGTLLAYASIDPQNPGIFIDLKPKGEGFLVNLSGTEYQISDNNDDDRIVTHVWRDGMNEDTSHDIDHINVIDCFSKK